MSGKIQTLTLFWDDEDIIKGGEKKNGNRWWSLPFSHWWTSPQNTLSPLSRPLHLCPNPAREQQEWRTPKEQQAENHSAARKDLILSAVILDFPTDEIRAIVHVILQGEAVPITPGRK